MTDEEPEKTTEEKPAEPTDDLVTSTHSLTVRRRKLNYTATTGRIVLRKEIVTDGKFDGHLPKAEVFLTAYTLDGADPAKRPVTFAFNGGPGSASVWLHLGLLGPRRVVSGDVGDIAPPPYGLVDNTETLLAHSDLVFIDPVSTGYSRPANGEKAGRLPRLPGRHRVRRRGDPALDLAQRPVDVAEVPRRRVLRDHPRRRARAPPADPVRHVPQRVDADLGRARLRVAGLHGRQRPAVRAVPADLRRDRALPRAARRPAARGGAVRGRGVRRARLPVGARPRQPSVHRGARGHRDPARRADRAVRGLRGPGEPAGRAHPVLHRAVAAQAFGGRPAGLAVHRLGAGLRPRAHGRRPVGRRTSWARTRPRRTTTCGPSWTIRTTCRTRCSASA